MTLRTHRTLAGLTQGELAERAGVSRQLVGAVEAGRHLPRVDAAIRLAGALGVDVGELFGVRQPAHDIVTGETPPSGSQVRAARVGDTIVTAAARVGPDGWDLADAVVNGETLDSFGGIRAGFVVAGCEPGLEVLERILREHEMGAVAASSSSVAARAALEAGRVHGAVVHGPDLANVEMPTAVPVVRFGLSRWRVGLAAPHDLSADWWKQALRGSSPVVQREPGAGVQRAFEQAAGVSDVPGPRVSSHVDAARRGLVTGLPAVTIEPAALATGAAFHPIEVHDAELWVVAEWLDERVVRAALDVVTSRRFRQRLLAIGGYDLTNSGVRVA